MSRFIAFRNGGNTDEIGFTKFLAQLFRPGTATGWLVSQRSSGANVSVDVSVGGGAIPSATTTYYGWSDAVENVSAVAANSSNPRNDILVAYVDLAVINALANNQGALKFKVVAGTATSTPVDPTDAAIQTSVGSGNPWIKRARIAMPAGTSVNVVDAYITMIGLPMALAMPYLWGGSNNTKGHVVPNVADSTVGLLSTLTAANMLFGGSVVTDANPGAGGGTRNYLNLGGLKIAWGTTAATTQAAGVQNNHAVTFPTTFASAPEVLASTSDLTGTANQSAFRNTAPTTTTVLLSIINNHPTVSGSGKVTWLAIGT